MPTPKLSFEAMNAALEAVDRYGGPTAAARGLGIPRQTLDSRLRHARSEGLASPAGRVFEPSHLPTEAVPDHELLDKIETEYNRRVAAHEGRRWFPIKATSNDPIGICWFGDPHLDSNGCNIPALRRDVDIVASTPGMVGANIGDSHDNWVGRLIKLYANASVTRREAIQLIEWFLRRSGIEWQLVLIGNHDEWNFGSELLGQITKNVVPLFDWQAQIRLTFPNGRELPIWAAHDFKGNSQWNPLHAPMKVQQLTGLASLYICGHKHNWAIYQSEDPHRGGAFWACRAKGYKTMDDYAEKLGHGAQEHGASIVSVIDPGARHSEGFLRCFADVEDGADYLTWLRQKRA